LPGEAEDPFVKEQTFDQALVWVILGILTVVVFIPLLLTGQAWWVLLLVGAILVLSMNLMASFKLHTRIDDDGVNYRMNPFHWKERTIPWEEIDQVNVRKYSPLREYGGWGIRVGLYGSAYNVKGNQEIQIVRKNGKRILLGTQKSDEAARQFERRPITV